MRKKIEWPTQWLCVLLVTSICSAEDWPQWRGPRADDTWQESGLVETFAADRLSHVWEADVGPGYTGPTVAKGRVYLMDRQTEPEQVERVLCFDANTGKPIWQHAYPCPYRDVGYQAGPRAAVTIVDDQAFSLGTMGHLHCYDAATGEVRWKRDLNHDYEIQRDDKENSRMPIWGIAASPLVYKQTIILQIGGRDGACVVALNRSDGSEVWRALDDRAQYSTPVLVQQAGRDLAVVWTGDSLAGIDAVDGTVHWRIVMTPVNMPIGIATPIVHDHQVFVTSFYDGSMLVALSPDKLDATEVWRARGPSEQETEALHSIISTPVWIGDHIYGVDSYGQLRCLEATTGKRVWEDFTATPRARWSTIHFVQNGKRTWMFNERGELIIATLDPSGFHETSRAKLIEPTLQQLNRRKGVCWSHPAFANGHVFVRNDERLVCASLQAKD